jgi:hypothetical protein
VAVDLAPPLQAQLESHFPDPASRTEFVNVALAQARDATSIAWALRRLSERYTADLTSKLSTSSQHDLEALVRDHVGSLNKELESLNGALLPLLTEVAETAEFQSSAQNSEGESTDWHYSVDLAFSDAQRIHDDVAVLLAGSTSESTATKGVVRDLQIVLKRATRRLPFLCQQVSGNFLSTDDLNARSQ